MYILLYFCIPIRTSITASACNGESELAVLVLGGGTAAEDYVPWCVYVAGLDSADQLVVGGPVGGAAC